MASPSPPSPAGSSDETLDVLLGYLNFSGGSPDANFRGGLNALREAWGTEFAAERLRSVLLDRAAAVEGSSSAFSDVTQARQVIEITIGHLLPAYKQFHADLLAHLDPSDFDQPYLLARFFETVLSQGTPFEADRIVPSSLKLLNDYVGFRPVAVLENGRQMQVYPHELFCPVPLYFQGVGVAHGPHRELLTATLTHLDWLAERVPHLFQTAQFSLDRMSELVLDHRPHDHNHPVNKRTNYMFGEWDPHQIDNSGFYTRFVLRQIILTSLGSWLDEQPIENRSEALFDAGAVLSGTVLMASAISGAGPESHMSGVSLSSLLPVVAGLRDEYYSTLMGLLTGTRRDRLEAIQRQTQQPFGHVRQGLNIFLARYGSMQVQLRELALIYARMGYPGAARETAREIPCLSTRFESEIQLRLTQAKLHLRTGHFSVADRMLDEIEDHFRRGIECGALIDPWNILGFQAQFPLFQSREDVAYDQRAETLLTLTEDFFDVFTLTLGEAAAQGATEESRSLSQRFRRFAHAWDRYATSTVNDLPTVRGEESWKAAENVAEILSRWRAGGEPTDAVRFWAEQIESLDSTQALKFVVENLLQKDDLMSSRGLLMRWLDLADEEGLAEIHTLLLRWLGIAIRTTSDVDQLRTETRRLFDYMEANAGDYWSVPVLQGFIDGPAAERTDLGEEDPTADWEEPEEYEDPEDELFTAAYDDVVFRDSADDGFEGEMAEGGGVPGNTEYDHIARALEPRLHFLHTIAQLFQMAGMALAMRSERSGSEHPDEDRERIAGWYRYVHDCVRDLARLLHEINDHEIISPYGDTESNLEYDMQLQRKLALLHQGINTHVSFRAAERALLCNLEGDQPIGRISAEQMQVTRVIRLLLTQRFEEAQQLLTPFLKRLAGKPLLYIPLENDGDPRSIQEARNRQAILQFLMGSLARVGLLRESFQVLLVAYRMERTAKPRGVAVTEFDRLFQTGLQSVLEATLRSAKTWDEVTPEELVNLIERLIAPYRKQWERHALTMRLSAIEMIRDPGDFAEMGEFIETYGADLLHTKDLTLGHLRTVLHNGVANYLDYLDEFGDPLHPVKLLAAIETGQIDQEEAAAKLEIIYTVIVDKFDRFLEYNTTTTHSDYGDRLFCLFEFLRVEAAYDRDAWKLAPVQLAHEMLCREGFGDAAWLWEDRLREATRETAGQHLEALSNLEQKYGVHLPSLRDHLAEQFVKPLAVNRMTALVPFAVEDASQLDRAEPSEAFKSLRAEVAAYLETASGSGIDIPTWLQNIEQEVSEEEQNRLAVRLTEDLDLPLRMISREELNRQLDNWSIESPRDPNTKQG